MSTISSGAGPISSCSACSKIAAARAGTNPNFICELRESVVVLHDHQPYLGWCVLLLKDHAEHVHELESVRFAELLADVHDVARAVHEAFSPRRLNYECLGNQLAHVHWHVIPRYLPPADPDPGSVIWVRSQAELTQNVGFEQQAEMIRRLRRAGLG